MGRFGEENVVPAERLIARYTPPCIVRGIQFSLAALLLVQAFRMMATGWLWSVVALALILLLVLRRRGKRKG